MSKTASSPRVTLPFQAPLLVMTPAPISFSQSWWISVKGHRGMRYAVLKIPPSAQHTAEFAPKLSSPSTELGAEHQLTYYLIFNLLYLTCIILFHHHDSCEGEVYYYPILKNLKYREIKLRAGKIPDHLSMEFTCDLLCDIVFQNHAS